MTNQEKLYYVKARKTGALASSALHDARIRARFDNLDGVVRIRLEPDDYFDIDDLMGDCFDEIINCNCPGGIRAIRAEKSAFINRVECDGVWVAVAEFFDGDEWIQTDCIGGFVGDDFYKSGYDIDLMASAIKAYDNSSFMVNI